MPSVVVYPTSVIPFPWAGPVQPQVSPTGSAGFGPLFGPGVGADYIFNLHSAAVGAGYGALSTVTSVRVDFEVQGASVSGSGNSGDNYSFFSYNGQTWNNEFATPNPPNAPHGGGFAFIPGLAQGATIPQGSGEIDYWSSVSTAFFVGAPGNIHFTVTWVDAAPPTPAEFSQSTKTTSTPGPVQVGAPVTYQLNAVNGGGTAGVAAFADSLPAGLTNVSWSLPGGSPANGVGNPATSVNIGPFSTATLTINATASVAGILSNTATIAGLAKAAPNITVQGPNFSTSTKTTTTPGPVQVGDTVTYQLNVKNTGTGSGSALIADTSTNLTNPVWSGAATGPGTITVAAGATSVITITGTATAVGTVTNSFTINGGSAITGPNVTVNAASVANFSTSTKTLVTPNSVQVGGTVTYNLNVVNSGTASGSVLLADSPTNLSNVVWSGAATGPGSITVAAGTTSVVTVTGTATAVGTVTNSFTINGGAAIVGPSVAVTAAPVGANFSTSTKTTSTPGPVIVGQTVVYQLNVVNSGSASGSALIADTSTNLSNPVWSGAATGPGSITVAAGATSVITITGTATAAGVVTNSFTINGGPAIAGPSIQVGAVVATGLTVTTDECWRNAACGEEVKMGWMVCNNTATIITQPVSLQIPPEFSAAKHSVTVDAGGTSTASSYATYGTGPISDVLTLPPGKCAIYEARLTVRGKVMNGTPLLVTLKVGTVAYPAKAMVREDTVQMERGGGNPARFLELLTIPCDEQTKCLAEGAVWDFLNEGGTLYHLIADLVERRGSPSTWAQVRTACCGVMPAWIGSNV